MTEFVPHVTVATVLKKDDLYLMVEEYSGGRRVINQPAGHVEHGESFIEAAVRETLEETGWLCEIQHLINISRWIHPRTNETYFRFTFAAEAKVHNHEQPLDDGIIQAIWLSYDEVISREENHRSPSVIQDINDHIAGKAYPLDILKDIPST